MNGLHIISPHVSAEGCVNKDQAKDCHSGEKCELDVGIMNKRMIENGMDSIASADNQVAAALDKLGYPEPRNRAKGFETFLSTIVSQQLSKQAAKTIMGRVKSLLPEPTPGALLQLPEGALRNAGLSGRKVEYAVGLARAIVDRKFNPEHLESLDDEQAIQEIVALRGFGRWSAEVYLMFSLDRPDIFPADDLALQRALQRLKKLPDRPTPMITRSLVEHWSPWRSVGSLFLWHFYRGMPA